MKQGTAIEMTITCNSKEELKAIAEAVKGAILKGAQHVEKDESDKPEPEAFQPKEGDICTCVVYDNIDAIFRYDGKTRTDGDGCVWLDGNPGLTCSEDLLKPYLVIYGEGAEYLRDDCRLATEEEIKLFNEKVKDATKEEEEWVLRKGDSYWTPSFEHGDGIFESVKAGWDGTSMEVCTKRRGWVFRTEEECQQLCDKLNEAIRNVKL